MSVHLTEKADVRYLYKIVSNNIIIKFMVSIKPDFNIERDDVKFGFNLHLHGQSQQNPLHLKVPI